MARSIPERKLIFIANTDLRLQALGFAAVGVWLALMHLVLEHGTDGRVVFGRGRVPSLADVARIRFRMTETELVTHLETQSETQLLGWSAESGALTWPSELMPDARTLANRENGKKGGRPRKTALNERNNPNQYHMPPMAIPGGRSMSTDETQKTQTETPLRVASLAEASTLKSLEATAEPDAREIDEVFQRIGPVAYAAAGFDHARHMGGWAIARIWAADGLRKGLPVDQIEDIVVGAIDRVSKRHAAKGNQKEIGSLDYFKGAVGDDIKAASPRMTQERRDAERAYEEAVMKWGREQMDPVKRGAQQPKLSDFLANLQRQSAA
ncbi:hypothetical protein AA103196_2286 [Ameyamaea chiangmaiensis NBRC 103196]|uniref:Uncharacterized protein n=1 Tax=Ameyamaea chiangmaiensis TaxID=442969 RepID=A0A850P7M7_9PROT|nr:hypothetical protein [Ameyamaea chiangmaiensis]MBS4075455.1 hypothetical protein [Ameyamaea chiangmaiensis]NVN39013.1 hypothetical protein [Ameyamaea chiangmaiensis]GBQ69699.1 hypothetical protein AA103196_2286 [Ameyamaea chiangmaiensis NBRC 103196]